MQTYKIHYNYRKIFKVQISKNRVLIYKKSNLIYDNEVKNIFIGLSLLNPMTETIGEHGPHLDGNSILLHEKDLTYIFIGESLYRFQAIAPIVSYSSPVGNNDVPYPHAVDEVGNYYLMIENVIFNPPLDRYNDELLEEFAGDLGLNRITNKLTKIRKEIQEPYKYYYNTQEITQTSYNAKLPLIMDISEYWSAHRRLTLTYNPDYNKTHPWNETDYVILKDGSKITVTKEMYTSIMEEAAKRIGVIRAINGEIIHDSCI